MTSTSPTPRPRALVVGSGVAGLTAAHILQRTHDVTLQEADDRLGGHAHTRDVVGPTGDTLAIDSGFIVHNDRTYPMLQRLFAELDVPVQDTEMSMSVRCAGCGLEYAGAKGVGGVLAQRSARRNPAFLRMLVEVTRFHRQAKRFLEAPELPGSAHMTLGAYLAAAGHSRYFTSHFMVPLVSAVWSAGSGTALQYPARYLFRFLDNHGMLTVKGSPQWRTVVGGSRTYVERAAKGVAAVRPGTPVRSLRVDAEGVEVRDDADDVLRYDRAVVATHPDQALSLLAEPTTAQREVLGAFRYSTHDVTLHTDESLLPRTPAARASWNHVIDRCEPGSDGAGDEVVITYDMNRLQRLDAATGGRRYLVTLDARNRIAPAEVLEELSYQHPVFTPTSVAAQSRLGEITSDRLAFAGAWQGWGFHEDGCLSGVRAAAALGTRW